MRLKPIISPILPTLLFSALLLMVNFGAVHAGERLPRILPPHGFDEGIETQLSAQQVAEILPWAQNSEIALKDLLESVVPLTKEEAKRNLLRGVQEVVLTSAPKQTEILMRYILNRALKIYQEIEEQTAPGTPGLLDQQVRVLRLSISLALQYFQSDVAFLNGQVKKRDQIVTPPFAAFGIQYASFLMSIDHSLFDASAQYNVAIMIMGLFQWDLYRDANKMAFAPAISKIQNALKNLPEKATDADPDTVRNLRALKMAYKKAMELAQGAQKKIADDIIEEERLKKAEAQARLEAEQNATNQAIAAQKAREAEAEAIRKERVLQEALNEITAYSNQWLNDLKSKDFLDSIRRVNKSFFAETQPIAQHPVPGCGDGRHSGYSETLHHFGDRDGVTVERQKEGLKKIQKAAVTELLNILIKRARSTLKPEQLGDLQERIALIVDFDMKDVRYRYTCSAHDGAEGVFLEPDSLRMIPAFSNSN